MDMKMTSPRWLALLLPALALGCSSRDEGTISFKELEAGFAEPSADYRPAPLWVWNGGVHTPQAGPCDRIPFG